MLLLGLLFPEPDPPGRICYPSLKLLKPFSSYGQDHDSHYSKDVDKLTLTSGHNSSRGWGVKKGSDLRRQATMLRLVAF